MDYSGGEVEAYSFLFELPTEDKALLAKFECFADVEKWEQDKLDKLDWLANTDENITYNIFDNISFQHNQDIFKHVRLPEIEDYGNRIIEDMEKNGGYNYIQFETMVTLWALKNKPEKFAL